MGIPRTISFLLAVISIYPSVHCKPECENVVCPQQLECRFPKVEVKLPDPNKKECCNITECRYAQDMLPGLFLNSSPCINKQTDIPTEQHPFDKNVCEGTDSRLSSAQNPDEQLETFQRLYENCTMIDGNLEIVYIHPKNGFSAIDVTKHIRIVTGYVLISLTYVHYIDLTSLRLIRGEHLYKHERSKEQACGQVKTDAKKGYALYIAGNFLMNEASHGLKEIHMPVLTEIMRGDVKISANRDLCFVDSIIWKGEILNSDTQKAEVLNNSATCPACPASCVHDNIEKVDDTSHCWGNMESLCQQFTRMPCPDVCQQGSRCSLKGNCCPSECAAGCTGGRERQCHACKFFNDFGKCVNECPTGSTSVSVDVIGGVDMSLLRYELFWFCVEECPETRRIFDKRCVLTCPENYYSTDGYCKECEPGDCSHICYGLEAKLGPLKNDDAIHSGNIGNFTKNCTIIEGSLSFRKSTFEGEARELANITEDGDTHCKIPALPGTHALDVFENVEEITGFLNIEHWPIKDLCLFKNLKIIRGYKKRRNAFSLLIISGTKDLRQLCLNSLQEIQTGLVCVVDNPGLCYVDELEWKYFFMQEDQKSLVYFNIKNKRKPKRCLPCDSNCDENGCWGSGSDQCVSCKNFTDYTNSSGDFVDTLVIDPATNKTVPGHNATTCVETCNALKGVYPTLDKKCYPCDRQCNLTCSGPGPSNCTIFSSSSSHGCKNVIDNVTCKAECPQSHYPDPDRVCQKCSEGCLDGGCEGPADDYGKDGCSMCYKKYDVDSGYFLYRGPQCKICIDKLKDFECALGCTYNNVTDVYHCYKPPSSEYIVWIIVVSIITILVVAIAVILYKCKNSIRIMRKHIGDKIVGDATQPDEFDSPLTPSGTAPNRAQLRIVKENELTLGKELGSGAFGSVYKAVWTSMHIGGQTIKIPVAVKQLKAFSHNNEIMDEAYVMASVDSPYLIRLLGICMTEQVSLITQLMPLGSLLEYVRGNNDSIGSRHMLTWCMQMAKGMQYLEDKHLVHRDLAARNVLVKTPHHVKITDFGLSKMLNATQSAYFAEGGKLPIKWLAIECITERKFSHQSDVWAFGVTCWEIFTFGARPYDGVRAVDVLSLLERGDRLIQPTVCTIDVYMLLIKCWLVDPLNRPRFSELVDEFTKMSHDHTRYLVLKNDTNSSLTSPNPEEERQFFERLIREDNVDIDGELMLDDPDTYLLSRSGASNELSRHYTFMSPATSTNSDSVGQEVPEYQNQPIVDPRLSVNGGPNGHDSRLFSRNTPSAQLPTPPVHAQSSDPINRELGRVHSRISDSSSPDDVFANSANSLRRDRQGKSMTVDLPTPEKGSDTRPVRYRPNQAGHPWVAQGRKDSEENSRYTEDPTKNNRSSYLEPMSVTPSTVDREVVSTSDQLDGMLYDEEEYLLPTPGPQSQPSDYIDPLSTATRSTEPPTMKIKKGDSNEFRSSLSNNTYLESGDLPPSVKGTHPSSWSNQFVKGHDEADAPEYVNSTQEHEYLNWNGQRNDTMMSDVVSHNDTPDQPLLGNKPSTSPGRGKREEVSYLNNEEYMTADSGIGEDNHSVLSGSNGLHGAHETHPTQASRLRQNSSLSSGGSSSNGSLGPLAASSPVHRSRLSSDEQQMDLERGAVRYKPIPRPRSQSKRSQKNTNVGLDNPEYMMLQESVSDSKALLDMDTGSSEA